MDLQIKSAALAHPFQQILPKAVEESSADFARFLQIAMGSASETEYLILLAHDLKYFNANQRVELTDTIVSVKKMLTGLLRNIKTTSR